MGGLGRSGKKAKKNSIITEDPPQLKNPPELGMLLPAGLDPVVIIPPSSETKNKSTKPTIASESQLATAVSSKIPVATKRRQSKELPTRAAKSMKLTSSSLSVPKPANNQTQNNSSVDDEDDNIYEEVRSDPNSYEISSYDEMYAIMPCYKPINDWNKDIDAVGVIDIFAASKERHKKDTKDDFEWVNPKTHPTNKQDIIQAFESSFSFIDGFIPSDI
jgi:hypothetical protein